MTTGWNYSDLSKLAKMNGGPEMLISKIRAGGYYSGLTAGRKEAFLWVVTSAVVAGAVIAYEEGPRFVKAVTNKFCNKSVVEEGKAAEKILLNEIKQADMADEGDNYQEGEQ